MSSIYHNVDTSGTHDDPIFNAQEWFVSRGRTQAAGSQPGRMVAAAIPDSADVATLQRFLDTRCLGTCAPIASAPAIMSLKKGLPEITGPITTASSYAEDLFLEAAECRPFTDFSALDAGMHLHVLAYTMNARNANAAVRGGNLYGHIVAMLLEKAGLPHGDIAVPDIRNDAVAFIVGHDTQLGALGGILNAHWNVSHGLVPDDMPPGGALVFDLYKTGTDYSVKVRFVYETMDQFRSKSKVAGGVQSVAVTCRFGAKEDCDTTPLMLGAVTSGTWTPNPKGDNGLVLHNWTPMTADPVSLAPLADPAWAQCR